MLYNKPIFQIFFRLSSINISKTTRAQDRNSLAGRSHIFFTAVSRHLSLQQPCPDCPFNKALCKYFRTPTMGSRVAALATWLPQQIGYEGLDFAGRRQYLKGNPGPADNRNRGRHGALAPLHTAANTVCFF
jgi:hypothetical protein